MIPATAAADGLTVHADTFSGTRNAPHIGGRLSFSYNLDRVLPGYSFSGFAGGKDQRALLNSVACFESGIAAACRERIAVQFQFMVAGIQQGPVVERVNHAAV